MSPKDLILKLRDEVKLELANEMPDYSSIVGLEFAVSLIMKQMIKGS